MFLIEFGKLYCIYLFTFYNINVVVLCKSLSEQYHFDRIILNIIYIIKSTRVVSFRSNIITFFFLFVPLLYENCFLCIMF